MKKIILPTLFTVLNLYTFAQNVGVGTASPAAKLDVSSSNSGVLIPRISLTALNSASPLTSPTASTLVYNTTTAGSAPNAVTPGYYYWSGSVWVRLIDNTPVTSVATGTGLTGGPITTTGTISLSTPVSVANGGTGTGTTPGNGQLLIGNGSGYSIGTVTGGTNITVTNSAGGISLSAAGSAHTGTGTANYLAKWTGSTSLSTGLVYDNGTDVGIGQTSPNATLDVNGNIQISNATIPMGLMTELGGTTPLLNFDINFRESNKTNTYRGDAFRIDTRSTSNVFQWLTRSMGSATENTIMTLSETGNMTIGTSAQTPIQLFQITGLGDNPTITTFGGLSFPVSQWNPSLVGMQTGGSCGSNWGTTGCALCSVYNVNGFQYWWSDNGGNWQLHIDMNSGNDGCNSVQVMFIRSEISTRTGFGF